MIDAAFKPYTWDEVYEMRENAELRRDALPKWDDLIP